MANPLCAACKAQDVFRDCTLNRAGVVDHIIAISDGGHRTDPRNLWTLCFEHHERKSKAEQHKQLGALPVFEIEGGAIPAETAKANILKILTA